jgi:transposase-like protein
MKLEQQQQAERLYFQTDLSKTQIADTLGISRRTLHNWVHENNWEHLRRTGAAMPALIAGNCYRAMAQLTEHILSPERQNEPITRAEVDSLYKLTLTINKLKARSVLSENMETLTWFLESVKDQSPELAEQIAPCINSYIAGRSKTDTGFAAQEKFRSYKAPVGPLEDGMEALLDQEDLQVWAREKEAAASGTYKPKTEPAPQNNTGAGSTHSATSETTGAKPKLDIRKHLRGTATSGPGKVLHQKQTPGKAAA